jgi:hypothetical protein
MIMSRLTNIATSAFVLACSALMLGGVGGAQAATANLTEVCTGTSNSSCSSGASQGTVTVDIVNSTTATVSVDLTGSSYFIADPTNDASVAFMLSGLGNSSDWNVTVNSGGGFNSWTLVGQSGIDHNENSAGEQLGTFTQGLSCFTFGADCGQDVTFTITDSAGGLTLGTGSTGSTLDGWFAAVDTCSGYFCSTNNALAGNISATPLPATLPLFGSVIGAGFLGFRRRRKALVGAAA